MRETKKSVFKHYSHNCHRQEIDAKIGSQNLMSHEVVAWLQCITPNSGSQPMGRDTVDKPLSPNIFLL